MFSNRWVRNLDGVDQVKEDATHMDLAEGLMEDIDRFRGQKEWIAW